MLFINVYCVLKLLKMGYLEDIHVIKEKLKDDILRDEERRNLKIQLKAKENKLFEQLLKIN